MVQIDKPSPPLGLFRYRRIPSEKILEQELDAIKENYLWLSNFTAMNDVMEGFYEPSALLEASEQYKAVSRSLTERKSSVGICCFSETEDNELMWAHYANNYAGICVEYSVPYLQTGLSDLLHLAKISYGHTPPRVTSKECKSDIDYATRKILSHKKLSWSYEREWRLLGKIGRNQISHSRVVKKVYLGSKLPPKYKDKIVKLLDRHYVGVFDMKVSGYRHSWQKYEKKAV